MVRLTRRTGGVARAKSPALPCGVVDEPAKAGGTAVTNRASGFLVAEACTPRGVATHLGKHWLNEPSAITSKAGNSNSTRAILLVLRSGFKLLSRDFNLLPGVSVPNRITRARG